MPRIAPTLFIGLGGSGCRVVTRLRESIENNPDATYKKFLWFLKIDSMIQPGEGVVNRAGDYLGLALRDVSGSEMVKAMLPKSEGGAQQNTDVGKFFASWWYKGGGQWDLPGAQSFESGAGQIRRYGRLVFAHHCAAFAGNQDVGAVLGNIQNSYATSLRNEAQRLKMKVEDLPQTSLDVVVFAGAAGGTGSSLLTDMGFLLREHVQMNSLTAVVFLDEVVTDTVAMPQAQRENMRDNTLRCLAELDYWQQPATRSSKSGPYTAVWNDGLRVSDRDKGFKPFDMVTIVGTANGAGMKLKRQEDYYNMVADFYSHLFGSELSVDLWQSTINVYRAEIDKLENNPKYAYETRRYSRLGMTHIVMPLAEIRQHIASKLLSEAIEQGFRHRHTANATHPQKGVVDDCISVTLQSSQLEEPEKIPLMHETASAGKNPRHVGEAPLMRAGTFDEVRTFAEFQTQVSQQIKNTDSYFSALDTQYGGARWMEQFKNTVSRTLDIFGGAADPGNISAANMAWYVKALADRIGRLLGDVAVDLAEADQLLKDHRDQLSAAQWKKWQTPFNAWLLGGNGRACAKQEAANYINKLSRHLHRRLALFSRRALLQEAKAFLDHLLRGIEDLRLAAYMVQAEANDKATNAFVNIQGAHGLQVSLVQELSQLESYRPRWFDKVELKGDALRIARMLISGKYDKGVPDRTFTGHAGLTQSAEGVVHYVKALFGSRPSDRDQHLEAFKYELRVMGDRAFAANEQYAGELSSLSAWEYIVNALDGPALRAEGKTDELINRLTKQFSSYRNLASPFGEIIRTGAALSPQPSVKSFIEYDRESARAVLGKYVDDVERAEDTILRPASQSALDPAASCGPDRITITSIWSKYPLNAFMGLVSIPSVFENPDDGGENWVDRRYPEWFKERNRLMNTDVSKAFCGLAFAWRDDGKRDPNSGLVWSKDKKKNTDYFDFSGVLPDTSHNMSWLFEDFPRDERAWHSLVGGLAGLWEAIPPAARKTRLLEASKALMAEAKRRANPTWKTYLQEAAILVKELSDNPPDRLDSPGV